MIRQFTKHAIFTVFGAAFLIAMLWLLVMLAMTAKDLRYGYSFVDGVAVGMAAFICWSVGRNTIGPE